MRVSMYRDGRTGIFYLAWGPREGRHRESTGIKDKPLANEIRRRKERELTLAETGIIPRASISQPPGVTFDKAIDEYLEHLEASASTLWTATSGRYLRWFRKSAPVQLLSEVRPVHVQAFVDGYKGAAKTRQNVRVALHAFFSWAVELAEYVQQNPVRKVKVPNAEPGEIRYATTEEIPTVLSRVQGDAIEALVASAIYAGLRREELARLDWTDVSLDRRVLTVWRKTKTKRRRFVPIFDELAPYLARLPLPHEGKVFRGAEGGTWEEETQLRELSLRVKRLAGLGLQDMRHTFITGALLAGESIYTVARWAGNSAEVIERHYAGFVSAESERRAQRSFFGSPRVDLTSRSASGR